MRPPSFAIALITSWSAIPATIVILEALCDNFYATVAQLLLVPVWQIIAVLSGAAAACQILERAWHRAALALVLPVAMLLRPSDLTQTPRHIGDIIHFVLAKPHYDREVAVLPHNGARFDEWNWGGMPFASMGVIYDETGEVALPEGRQSPSWVLRESNTDVVCHETQTTAVVPVEPLWDHYYLAAFGC